MPLIEVIYLNRYDTANTVRELLASATPGAQVWLVAPWRLGALADLVNVKLIRRMARSMGVDLRLVSLRSRVRELAREAGIPAYVLLPRALHRYRRVRRRAVGLGLARRVVPVDVPLPPYWRTRPRHLGLGMIALSVVLVLILMATVVGTAVALFPSATVELELMAHPISGSLSVTAHPMYGELDYGRAIIPARNVQVIVSGRGETPTSGRKDVADSHASGEVVFINRTSEEVIVPKGTIVRTSSGINVRFYTVTDVTIPAEIYGHARVGIIAMEPGPVGNVDELTINVVEGEVATEVEVLNDVRAKGGDVRRLAIVAKEDLDRLKDDLASRLQQEAHGQLVAELEDGEFIPPKTLRTLVMAQYYDQDIGEESDILSMELKVVVRGIAVDGRGLDRLAAHYLGGLAGEGMALIEGSLYTRHLNLDVEGEGMARQVAFRVAARGMAAPVIDEEQIKAALRGKRVSRAVGWLEENLQLRRAPRVTVMPGNWQYLPILPGRLRVVVSAGESAL